MSESEAAQELGGTGFDGSEQWSDAQVLEALGSAGRSEFGGQTEQAPPAPTPEGATDAAPEAEVQAEAEVAPEPTQTETFDGGKFNPDDLPPELQDGWKQLQAAFTQKTQALAEREKQFTELGDPESLQQAVDLYTRIGDPTNWQQLHAELTQAMQGMGMTPLAAEQAATEALTPAPAPAPDTAQFEDMDPEMASLAKQLQETRSELDQFKAGFQEQLQNQEAERQYIQAITELQKQEAAIREAHPSWGDDKIEAAYQLSSFYNGSLAQGAARLEQVLAAERELYLSQKAGAMDDSTRTPATNFAPEATKVAEAATLKDAEAEAEEWFKARLAELDS